MLNTSSVFFVFLHELQAIIHAPITTRTQAQTYPNPSVGSERQNGCTVQSATHAANNQAAINLGKLRLCRALLKDKKLHSGMLLEPGDGCGSNPFMSAIKNSQSGVSTVTSQKVLSIKSWIETFVPCSCGLQPSWQ